MMEMVEKERVLQEQVRVFEEKVLKRKEKLLKLQKDYSCIMEENIKLKILVKGMIVLGLGCFLFSLWMMKKEGSRFKYLVLA